MGAFSQRELEYLKEQTLAGARGYIATVSRKQNPQLRARERGFNVFNLTKWFNWRSADMALHYTQSVDMAKALGIPEIP